MNCPFDGAFSASTEHSVVKPLCEAHARSFGANVVVIRVRHLDRQTQKLTFDPSGGFPPCRGNWALPGVVPGSFSEGG